MVMGVKSPGGIMTLLYVSGPMTGLPEHNFPAFHRAECLLSESGYRVENPAHKGILTGWTWADYLRHDLRRMLDCDGVAALPGHRMSRGARLELHVARELGMPIHTVRFWQKAALVRLTGTRVTA